MKKIISLFLAIMVICSLISINAFASSDVPMTIIGELNEYNSQTVYSNEELNQIADEISEFTDNFNDIRCIKVSKEHKCIVIYISDSFESEKLKELAQLFEKKYPNAAFVFSGGNPDDEFTISEEICYGYDAYTKGETGISDNGVLFFTVCAFIILFAFLLTIFVLQRKKQLAYQTADICDSAYTIRNISRGTVLADIKNNEHTPDKNTFSSIMEQIDKHT